MVIREPGEECGIERDFNPSRVRWTSPAGLPRALNRTTLTETIAWNRDSDHPFFEKDDETMPTITVEGAGSYEVEAGQKLVLAIEDAGVDIMHRCGGNARCTTCRVEVLEGTPPAMNDAERERLAREEALAPGIRLSCQMHVDGDLSVRVLKRASAEGIPAGPRPMD